MPSLRERENREIQDVLRTDKFLRITGNLLTRFVPLLESDRSTIIPSIVVRHKKGDITIGVSGERNEHGLWEEGRVHFIRNGKQWTVEAKAIGIQPFPDMEKALKVMHAVAKIYRRSNLPRRNIV